MGSLKTKTKKQLIKEIEKLREQIKNTDIKGNEGNIDGHISSGEDITKRNQTEDALAYEHYLFHTLMNHIPDAIYFKDKDSHFIRINKAQADMFGLDDPAEAVGMSDFDFFKNEHAQVVYMDEQEVIKSGKPLVCQEEKETWPDGHETWALTTKMPFLDKEGKIVGTFGISRDITGRKQAEEALRESDLRYRLLIETSASGVNLIDKVGKFLIVNTKAAETWGKKPEDFINKNIKDVMPKEMAGELLVIIQQVHERGIGFEQERFIEPLNKYFIENIQPVFNDKKEFLGVQVITTDITKRKRADEALKESEEQFQNLFNSMREGFALCQIILDEKENPIDYRFLKINPAFGEQTGMSVTDSLGKTVKEIYPDIEPYWIEKYGSVAITGEPMYTQDYNHNTKKWYDVVAFSPSKGKFATLFRDITERKQAEEEIQIERDNLRNILESMDDGVYIVNQKYDIQYVNPVLKKEFGEVKGHKCYEYFHDRKDVCPWCQNKEVWKGKTVRWEWYSFKNQRTYDLIDTPLKNPDGSICKLEIFRDITERRQTEEKLRESEKRLDLAIKGTGVGTWDWMVQDGEITYSERWAEIIGYTLEELSHRHPEEIYSSGRSEKIE